MSPRKSEPRFSHLILLAFGLTALILTLAFARTMIRPNISVVNSTLPVCNNFKGMTISKTTLNPGEKFTYTCDYGNPVLSCAIGVSTPNNVSNNTWLKFSHAPARFEARAPTQPGKYTLYCSLSDTTLCRGKNVNPCQNQARGLEYEAIGQVSSSSSPRPNPNIPTSLTPTPNSTILPGNFTLTWDHVASATGYKIDLTDNSTNITAHFTLNTRTNSYTYNFLPSRSYTVAVSAVIEGKNPPPATTQFTTSIEPPPVPGNLRTSCNADGKTVTFTWDQTNNTEFYKLRVDDKSGHVTHYDGLKSTQTAIELAPNHTYVAWVHSHKNNADSKESSRIEFKCNVKPPVPANPRVSCNSSGTTATFTWDTVSSASFYKLRLDDKQGNIKSIDDLKTNKSTQTIKPNTTYTWWAHSSISSADSEETKRQDFKCTPVASPTPTPSVSPSPSPTRSPSPSPTRSASPSPTALFPSPTTISTPTPVPTPNNYSTSSPSLWTRFLNWLKSLFTS